MNTKEAGLDISDLFVVVIYFVIIFLVGIFVTVRSRQHTVQGYFLAGRNMRWFMVGASLFVSNIGSEHFIGLAGSGASGGIGVGAWELNALLLLQLLGWIFIPVYISSGVCTMPEYLGRRFGGGRLRVYLAVLTLLLYCLTKISVNLYSGALFLEDSMDWSMFVSITLLVLMTGVLTVTGGLTVVMYTDLLQAFLMVGGALYLTVQGFIAVGGYYEMKEKYLATYPNLTSTNVNLSSECPLQARNDSFIMLKGIDDDEMPWLGFLLGQTPSSIWYWCTDQVIVQRALAAKTLSHAQGGTLMAGALKILPIFIMVMPGMISRVLFTDSLVCVPGEHCLSVCGSAAGCTNHAYPKLVLNIMPSGARGLMMAVIIAALMSDLDSIFNSASTIFTLDLWRRMRKSASNRELMIVGRVFILLLIGISIAWVPIIQHFQGGQLFFYIQEVTNYISPPIAAIFLIGILWPGCTEKGAFYGGLCGSALGISRLVVIFLYKKPICGEEDTRPAFLKDFHYMYFAALLFFITLLVAALVSMFTKKPSRENVSRLTYWTRDDPAPSVCHEMEIFEVNGSKPQVEEDLADDDDERYSLDEKQRSAGNGLKTILRRFLYFICGFNEESSAPPVTSYPSIEQSLRTRVLLSVGLIAILACGVALYVFWSV